MYGGIGTKLGRLTGGVFASSGTMSSAARRIVCSVTESAKARRRTLRSRARCSASPSIKQTRSEPRFSLAELSASSGITHLQTFAASDSELLLRRLLQVALQPPAQRSQGCEGARVLLAFDTGNPRKFPPRCRLGARRLGILSCGPPKTAEKKSLGGGVAGRFGMRERVAISL